MPGNVAKYISKNTLVDMYRLQVQQHAGFAALLPDEHLIGVLSGTKRSGVSHPRGVAARALKQLIEQP